MKNIIAIALFVMSVNAFANIDSPSFDAAGNETLQGQLNRIDRQQNEIIEQQEQQKRDANLHAIFAE
ncbi:MAG TPA: hypothetical protein VK543_02750 [Puia sp.]|nr:hypothetical protein [Puia sp.]